MSQKEDKIVPGSGPIRPTQCNTSKHRFTHPNTPSGSVLSKDTERTPLLVPLGKTPFQPAPNLPLLVPVQPQGNMVKPSPNSTALSSSYTHRPPAANVSPKEEKDTSTLVLESEPLCTGYYVKDEKLYPIQFQHIEARARGTFKPSTLGVDGRLTTTLSTIQVYWSSLSSTQQFWLKRRLASSPYVSCNGVGLLAADHFDNFFFDSEQENKYPYWVSMKDDISNPLFLLCEDRSCRGLSVPEDLLKGMEFAKYIVQK